MLLGIHAIDVSSYAHAVLKTKLFDDATKSKFPKRWRTTSPHTHLAVDDAIEQGELFLNILRENLG
jgi:hypothetical protein